jgi:hypothetical protein
MEKKKKKKIKTSALLYVLLYVSGMSMGLFIGTLIEYSNLC